MTAFEANFDDDNEELISQKLNDPFAFLSRTQKDTMYYHEAMKQPDRDEFIQAIVDEFDAHDARRHWDMVKLETVPPNEPILDAVWSMKRKRHILTQKVYKWKARLNLHGGQQEFGANFFETYAPVVSWYAIRLFMTLSIINKWHTRQIDFVLAYPQAPIEQPIYMKLPPGIGPKDMTKEYVLKLRKNIYGQKQAGKV